MTTSSSTCPKTVYVDSWHSRVCGRPVKRDGLCDIHVAAAERARAGTERKVAQRRHGEEVAEAMEAALGVPVWYNYLSTRPSYVIGEADAERWFASRP